MYDEYDNDDDDDLMSKTVNENKKGANNYTFIFKYAISIFLFFFILSKLPTKLMQRFAIYVCRLFTPFVFQFSFIQLRINFFFPKIFNEL